MTADSGLASWLQLSLTPGLDAGAIRELLKRFGLPEQVLAQPRAELARLVGAEAAVALGAASVRRAVERALDWAKQPGCAIVALGDASYPGLLLEIADPPVLLYARGRLELLERAALAVVGSRNATAQGVRDAERFARTFSEAGLTIVSGLALGIDAAAHRGALQGAGSTIAVLGTGIDRIYPARNQALGEAIAERGLLLSEFALGAAPAAHHFPRRNRLISGLARGCLVVEAALGSGSLITARSAAEQGREVFALPGSIHSPLAKGCHQLIRSGAKLVESAEDVLSELTGFVRSAAASTLPVAGGALQADAARLLEQMDFAPVGVDALSARAGQPAERVVAQLLELELAGRVAALPGGLFQRLD
jgi:DNA processing protein